MSFVIYTSRADVLKVFANIFLEKNHKIIKYLTHKLILIGLFRSYLTNNCEILNMLSCVLCL